MAGRSKAKRVMQGLTVPAICVGLVGYFGWHALYGEYGMFGLVRIEERLSIRSAELATVAAERARLERRVALLRPENLDRDMLDEQARASLGYSDPDEITILIDR